MSDAPDPDDLREVLAYYDSWLAFNQRYQRVPGVQAAVYATQLEHDQHRS